MSASSPEITAAWEHRGDLVLYAGRVLGVHGDLAEDIVQDAYLRLHEQAAAGATPRDARPWLFRVTRNLALDERRRIRRGDALRTTLEVVTKPQVGPYDVVQRREEARQALRGLDALPSREKRTVILDQAGVAPSVIARVMDTTTNAVHQSLFRARRRMRDTRAAAWGLVPVPIIRFLMRAGNSSALEQLPMLAPGGAGRFAGGAGLAGFALTALVGGGVIAQQVVVPGALHDSARSAVPAPRPSLQSPAPRATPIADVGSSAGPSQGATVVVRSAPSVTPRTNRSVTRPRRVVARSPLAAISAVAAPSPSSTPPPRTGDDDHDDVSVERHEPAVDQRNGASSGERSVPEERQGRRGHSGARSVPDDPEPNEQQPDEPAPAERQEIPTPDPPEQGTDHSGPPVSAAGTSATSPESLESPTPTEPAEEPDHG